MSTEPIVQEYKTASSTPFFSQFDDITSKYWGPRSCGIASLGMVIEEHTPGALPSLDSLLHKGIDIGGFSRAGWIHSKLVSLASNYGLRGEAFDVSDESTPVAIESLEGALTSGPALASVHYKLDPKNPIPHLIVVHSVGTSTVTISDPANKKGNEIVPLDKFVRAWKKRYISFNETHLAQN